MNAWKSRLAVSQPVSVDDARTIDAIELLATHVGDFPAQHEALHALGFTEAQAHRLIAFVPAGFATALLEKLGAAHSDEASILLDDRSFLNVSLNAQPIYAAAVSLGRAHLERGVLRSDVFSAIVLATAEAQAASNALNEGVDVRGGVFSTVFHDPELAKYVAE